MIQQAWHKPSGKLVLALVIASNAVFAFMALVTMPQIAAMASGMTAPEISQSGYDADYVAAFLQAAGEEGRSFYLYRQVPVDMVYACLYLLSSLFLWRWLWLRRGGKKVIPVMGGIAALNGTFFDWSENISTAMILSAWPDMDAGIVEYASLFTQLKFAFVNVGLLSLLVYGGLMLYHHFGGKRQG